ncbi:putative ribonuclease H-like domain-containing protein [Tanacetum coccineum]|uniref:Ribonuclease H-like domain-containing protein n=1 Tax=Tanacetum coccineum TaxID=301880 RepID=A0ABQ5I6N6_9ASTR
MFVGLPSTPYSSRQKPAPINRPPWLGRKFFLHFTCPSRAVSILVPVILVPWSSVFPCKVSYLVAVETLYLRLVISSCVTPIDSDLSTSFLENPSCPHAHYGVEGQDVGMVGICMYAAVIASARAYYGEAEDRQTHNVSFLIGYGPKTSKSVSEDISNEVRESPDALLVEELVSDDKLEKKTVFPTDAKMEFADCNYHQRERVVSGNNYTRVNYNYSAKKAYPSAHRNMLPRAVLMKISLRSVNIVRPVNTADPKTTVYNARPMSRFSKLAQSTVKRPYQLRTEFTNKNFSQKVNTAKGKIYIARPKAVNTTRPNLAVVNAVRTNQVNVVKASACWVWRPTKPNSASITLKRHNYVDARGRSKSVMAWTSRNLIEDILHLGEEPNEGKLLMCDKKNSVLFTDTGCFVLSPDFKLADESQVLLKVPRKNNMYSVDMKNIVPKESLTCLVAKATLDESMLWHRRLGHVNFKTINKLVKENLVRGLPIKRFENDQTCVACLKGKQHKASCKSKIQNSITQPLFMLHMDLFGLTFMSSLMNKKYYLVVTDDYSRFKDETSGIRMIFITEVENLVDKKVKIIRCDNGTELKNRVMSKFCEKKDIKKEFSVARTPQQNGVAERRNRTLIEAARTMLADSKLPTTF